MCTIKDKQGKLLRQTIVYLQESRLQYVLFYMNKIRTRFPMGITVIVLQMTEMVQRKIIHKIFSKPKTFACTYNIEKYYKISDVKMLIETLNTQNERCRQCICESSHLFQIKDLNI